MIQNNPLLDKSTAPFGAPMFDKISIEHYAPAFDEAIRLLKEEIDAIVANPEPASFENTIEALEYSGRTLSNVESVFFNLLEACSNEQMQNLAQELAPKLNDCSMYVTMNRPLFERVKTVYESRGTLGLEPDQERLLEDTYKTFIRQGVGLEGEDRQKYAAMRENMSRLTLKFSDNIIAATHDWILHLTDESDLEGLPQYVRDMGASAASEKNLEGWVFTLDRPSMFPFMKFSTRRDLREKFYKASNSRCIGGEFDNVDIIRQIVTNRLGISNILGFKSYSDYALEDRMASTTDTVISFLDKLMTPSLPAARKELSVLLDFAKENGFEGDRIEPWDFAFWSEKLKQKEYAFGEEMLKPYFQLENVIDAVFDLATRLYGLTFNRREDIPVYHKDVQVYEVFDEQMNHLSLFYADFFPRDGKSQGAWMTEFRGQFSKDGVDYRPFISIVTNFTKPTETSPSLLTHEELTTFLHEFGHALHGMLSRGRYPSLCGTNVARDFVELPSQIMENWAFEPEYLQTFAKDYRTGETIPTDLISKIVKAQNFHAAYAQVRQLHFGLVDMAWHTLESIPENLDVLGFEKAALSPYETLPFVEGCAVCPSFGHIFSGGYSAGYYSYKWAEVLEADAFSLFKELGIFSREAAGRFQHEILERGSSQKEDVLYRNFRGHDPEPEALLRKLGIIS